MPFLVYQITNTLNGKRYIGYTSKTLEQRFREHKNDAGNGSNCRLHCAIRKYGTSSFVPSVLCEEDSIDGAKESEILYILDKNPEYNMTLGGDCGPVMLGQSHPLYGAKRPDIALVNKSRTWSEEQRQKAREKQLGRKATPEAREKMSLARKGKKRGKYNVLKNTVSVSNARRKGTLAAALAAKKASLARWARVTQEKLSPE